MKNYLSVVVVLLVPLLAFAQTVNPDIENITPDKKLWTWNSNVNVLVELQRPAVQATRMYKFGIKIRREPVIE